MQRETVLRLDTPDGSVIGRAFEGAHVRVERVTGVAAEITLAQFERPVRVEGGVKQVPLTAWVDVSALGTREAPLVEPPPSGRAVRDHYSRIADRPGELGFFYTHCGPLQIIEQDKDTTRVAQRAGGVELVGWSELPIRAARGDFRCPARVAETGTPSGFAQVRSVDAASVLRAGQTVHWLVETDDDGYACTDWHVTKDELRHTGRAHGERVETLYTIEREGDRVTLLGPTTRSASGQSSLGCGDDYRAVDVDAERLVLVPHAGSRRFVAYDPDDTEVWYLSEPACRAAAARASSPPTLASIPPIHTGC